MYAYWLCAILSSIPTVDLLFIQLGVLIAITAYYFIANRDELLATQLLWAYITLPLFFIKIHIYLYIPIVFFLSMRSYWLAKREIINNLPHNKENIILAFYQGKNINFKMRMWSLLDMHVSSMCIINGNKVLRIKNKKYVLESSKDILKNKNYLKYDTGIKANDDILNHMNRLVGMENQKSLFYSDCIASVSSLLYDIDPELKPKNWLETRPSRYFRKVLKIGKR